MVKVKENIDLKEVGVDVVNTRTNTGSILLEVCSPKAADLLDGKLRYIVRDMARVSIR